jgi:hypothetical protein
MPRSTLKHTLVATLAASALITSTAAAKPVDRVDRFDSPTSSLAGTVAKQDLRGEQALEAARLAAQPQDLRGEHARDAARFNGRAVPARPPAADPVVRTAPAPKPGSDGDDLWLVLGIALAATGIVAVTAMAASRRSRLRVPA